MPLDECTLERMRRAAEERQREAERRQEEVERRRQEDGEQGEAGRRQPGQPPGPVEADTQPGIGIQSRLGDIFRSHDFRFFWGGQFISLLGEQLFLVALPWLVLQLTGSAFAVGTVVAVTTAPRAVFILLGGALIDRFSPRLVMLYANGARVAVVAFLAFLTFTQWIQLWMLYPFGFLVGLGYALYLPSQSAIVPRLVPQDRLQAGNALIQGTAQMSLFLGPLTAGLLIGFLGQNGLGEAALPEASGIGVVFSLTALGFLVSAATLRAFTLSPIDRDLERHGGLSGVFRSLADAMADIWRDRTLRLYLMLIAAVNLALLGSLQVGIPVLADARFPGGAFAYGSILSGIGAGALLGVILAGILRRPPGRAFAAALLGSSALLGLGLAALGIAPVQGAAIAAAFLIGIAEGYLLVQFITWLQLRTSKEELGRMMSILLFVSIGQAPVSNLIAGALLQLSVTVVMVAAGGFIVLVVVIAALSPAVWRLGEAEQPVG